MVRPPGVTTNGDMFGTGIYFADQPMKSLGYCDMSGIGRWASGSEPRAFLAVFKVNVGNQFNLKHKGDHRIMKVRDEDELGLNKIRPFSYDSVRVFQNYKTTWGTKIYNSEYIIYEAPRCTIAGFVEVRPA